MLTEGLMAGDFQEDTNEDTFCLEEAIALLPDWEERTVNCDDVSTCHGRLYRLRTMATPFKEGTGPAGMKFATVIYDRSDKPLRWMGDDFKYPDIGAALSGHEAAVVLMRTGRSWPHA